MKFWSKDCVSGKGCCNSLDSADPYWSWWLLCRELEEETGMRSVSIVAEHPLWLTYQFHASIIGKLPGQWRRWRGQVWDLHSALQAVCFWIHTTCVQIIQSEAQWPTFCKLSR